MFSDDVKASIQESILCWLATSGEDNFPSVSPKEIFTFNGDNEILIANIASPNSVNNILENPKVCVSFIHVFKQKGFQIYGSADYITKDDSDFSELYTLKIQPMTDGVYPVAGIIRIRAEKIKPIVAPSYALFPDIPEEDKVKSAKKHYGLE
ncbi:pyridoxamine 5'-phosphate oxidase family protein [Marinomonas sp. C2222]|uniref:Pyridoxamine 5'-phosphate oxidase family protein n=1 Tax=Marinomonas sargassi TaxID=2984494 RepID=A0ABT2YRB4_9GAMM|nr:pyridoxamine 5'-phosphate oxidase family protein [Marinomonas sargassi]MCV2402423.1 pyridoxamine 5'-phosphate oxidase family protein [Marinomonas sargassi]